MPRYLLTFVSFFIFAIVLALIQGEVGVRVSRDTSVHTNTDLFSVKQGFTPDGLLRIDKVEDAPRVSHRVQFSNHARNLRVFVAPNSAGVPTLYLERVKPRESFSITGAFALSPDVASFVWNSLTSISFTALDDSGIFRRYKVDVHELTAQSEILASDFTVLHALVPNEVDL